MIFFREPTCAFQGWSAHIRFVTRSKRGCEYQHTNTNIDISEVMLSFRPETALLRLVSGMDKFMSSAFELLTFGFRIQNWSSWPSFGLIVLLLEVLDTLLRIQGPLHVPCM